MTAADLGRRAEGACGAVCSNDSGRLGAQGGGNVRGRFAQNESRQAHQVRTFYVYIMASASRALYIGVTNDIRRRALEHRRGEVQGFAAKYRAKELVYVEAFSGIRDAIAREKQIKRWVRAKKIALIELQNPGWKDLGAEWRTK